MTETPPKGSISVILKALREMAGLSVREVAAELEMPASTYAHYESPKRYKGRYLPLKLVEPLAAILSRHGVDPADVYALAGVEEAVGRMQENDKPASVRAVQPSAWPQDLPLRPMRALSSPGADTNLEGYELSEDSVEVRRRPPGLATAREAYCTYVPSDALYRYERGDMIVVAPDRVAKIGDAVILTVAAPGAKRPIAYIGRLLKADRQWTVIEIDRPPGTSDQFATTTVISCHKILSTEELLGF